MLVASNVYDVVRKDVTLTLRKLVEMCYETDEW